MMYNPTWWPLEHLYDCPNIMIHTPFILFICGLASDFTHIFTSAFSDAFAYNSQWETGAKPSRRKWTKCVCQCTALATVSASLNNFRVYWRLHVFTVCCLAWRRALLITRSWFTGVESNELIIIETLRQDKILFCFSIGLTEGDFKE